MARNVHVIGVGMTPFSKPSAEGPDYPELARQAGEQALSDAGQGFVRDRARCGTGSGTYRDGNSQVVYLRVVEKTQQPPRSGLIGLDVEQ